MPLTLTTKFIDHVYIIHCSGAIILGDEAKSLEAILERCSHASSQLILNVADVHRLDSMGLGLIVRHMTNLRKRGGDLRLAAPSPFIASLLKTTTLDTVIQTHPTEQAALQSFLKKPSAHKAQEQHGRRVLLIDSSPDLCAFVRSVLSQHGFDIQSTSMLRDAKVLLRSDAVNFILIGPSNAHLTSEIVAQTLGSTAPKSATRHLGPDFKTRNAHEATEILLQMFGITRSHAQDA